MRAKGGLRLSSQSRFDPLPGHDVEAIHGRLPALEVFPFSDQILHRQEDGLEGRFFVWKRTARSDDFADGAIQRLHRVGRVDPRTPVSAPGSLRCCRQC